MNDQWLSPIDEWAAMGALHDNQLLPRLSEPWCNPGQLELFSHLLLQTDRAASFVPTSSLLAFSEFPFPANTLAVTEGEIDQRLAAEGAQIAKLDRRWQGLVRGPGWKLGLDRGFEGLPCAPEASTPKGQPLSTGHEDRHRRAGLRAIDERLRRMAIQLHTDTGGMQLATQHSRLKVLDTGPRNMPRGAGAIGYVCRPVY